MWRARAAPVDEGGDPTLCAHIRLNRASALGDQGGHAEAAGLLERTLSEANGVAAVEVANLHAVAGRCWARAGRTRFATAHAHQAEDLYSHAGIGDLPPWATQMLADPGHVLAVIGRTWLVAGQYTRAVDILTATNESYASSRERGRVGCLTRRAHARLILGDLDGCDQDINSAARASKDISSIKSARELARIQQIRLLRS